MDEAIILGAKRAIRYLEKTGQIGKSERKETLLGEYTGNATNVGFEPMPGLMMFGTILEDSVTEYPDKAVVVINGVRYECEKQTIVAGEAAGTIYYGNAYLAAIVEGLEFENTGEPFVLLVVEPGFQAVINDPTLKTEHTIGFIAVTETIHPISDKYLPGVCLPVVELETAIGEMAPLSEADSAKLNKAAATGLPIVCKCTLDTIPYTLVCNLIQPPIDSGNGAVYVTVIGSTGFQVMTQDGTNWMGGKLTA